MGFNSQPCGIHSVANKSLLLYQLNHIPIFSGKFYQKLLAKLLPYSCFIACDVLTFCDEMA